MSLIILVFPSLLRYGTVPKNTLMVKPLYAWPFVAYCFTIVQNSLHVSHVNKSMIMAAFTVEILCSACARVQLISVIISPLATALVNTELCSLFKQCK